jgi:hypothetical protein
MGVFKSIVKCETLGLEGSFQGTFFGYAFSKACQYGTNDKKICKGFKHVSYKFA